MSEIIDIKNLDVSKLTLGSVPKPEPVVVVVEVPAQSPAEPVVEESVPLSETLKQNFATETKNAVATTGETTTIIVADNTTVSFEPVPFPEAIVPTGPTGPGYTFPPVDATPKPKPIGDKVYTGTKWIFGAVCVVFLLIFLAQFAFNLPHPKYWHLGAFGSNRGTVETVFVPVVPPPQAQIKIVESGRFLTAYQFPDGQIVKLTGGSVSWQLNNPGRLAFNKHSSSFGAFAKVKGYAAFPSYEQGHKALESMLFDDPRHGYRSLSIKDAIKKFNENDSDSAEYARLVGKALKLPVSTKLADLSDAQKQLFIDQIKTIEQFVPGRTWLYKDLAEYKRLG